jgi:hypothetical protein
MSSKAVVEAERAPELEAKSNDPCAAELMTGEEGWTVGAG